MLKKLLLGTLAVAALTGCSKNELEDAGGNGGDEKTPIRFGSSIVALTKAGPVTGTAFTNGDLIGVFGYKGETAPSAPATAFLSNAAYTYTTGSFKTSDANAYWERNKKHYFYAYYPLDATNAPVTTAAGADPIVKVTVGTENGAPVDLMWASLDSGLQYAGTAPAAALTINHKLSVVRFVVKTENAGVTAALTNVAFTVDKNTGELNVRTGALAESGTAVTLTKAVNQTLSTSDYTVEGWTPLLLPSAQISDIKLTINGTELTAAMTTAPVLEAGKETTITITVKGTGLDLTGSRVDWTTGGTNGEGSVTD